MYQMVNQACKEKQEFLQTSGYRVVAGTIHDGRYKIGRYNNYLKGKNLNNAVITAKDNVGELI